MRLYHGSNAAFKEIDLSLLFRQFALGLVSVEMLVREMRYKQLTVQYSFHTPAALASLAFAEVDDVH